MAVHTEEDQVESFRERWHKAEQASQRARTNYWLNYAFYEGHQWLFLDRFRKTVETNTTRDPDGKARLTINRFRPNIETLVGKFCQSDLNFEVPASASDDSALTGARLGEYALEAERIDGNWEGHRKNELLDMILGGVSAVVMHPAKDGPYQITAGNETGKLIEIQSLSLAEFAIQPGARDATKAMWWFQQTAVPPEEVREHYGLDYTPGTDTAAGLDPLVRSDTGQTFEDVVRSTTVYVMYERPSKLRPEGRVVHLAGGKILADEKWPFPFKDRLNLSLFSCSHNRKGWIAGTFVTHARPLQSAYNLVRSNILEHSKRAGQARVAIPVGSVEDDENWSDIAGEHFKYDPEFGEPHYMQMADLGRWLTMEPAALKEELDDIMYVHAISRGEAPGDRNSGLALSILAEKDDTPLGAITSDQALNWADYASMYLRVAEKSTGKRVATYRTPEGVPIEIKWSGKQLAGQIRVHVPREATSPYSRAAKMAELVSLKQNFPEMFDRLDPGAMLRIADFPGLKNLGELISAQASKAIRENHLMAIGEPQLPEPYDDHPVHIAEHQRFRASQKFDSLPLKDQQSCSDHILAHEVLAAEQAAEQMIRNQIMPGIGALPQADAPQGSLLPSPQAEQAIPVAGQVPI